MRNALFSVVIGLVCGPAFSQPQIPGLWDFAHEKKMKCSSGNMMEMNGCLAGEYAESDARLNAVYKHLLNALADSAPLRRAQVAWV